MRSLQAQVYNRPMSEVDLHAALHQHFNFPAFRPGQEAALQSVLGGHHTLVVMPTGSGKSLNCSETSGMCHPERSEGSLGDPPGDASPLRGSASQRWTGLYQAGQLHRS